MKNVKKALEERRKYLLKLQREKKRELVEAPEGTLRINLKAGRVQYYQRTNPKNFTGTYIRKNEHELARKLAQKDYDKKIILSAAEELEAIEKYLHKIPENTVEEIYQTMREERQNLVSPIVIPQEQYVREWQEKTYEGKGFDAETPEIYTAKGERVRSKSELIIADMLEREGIPYRYECPLHLKGWGYVYPDFTVLQVKERREIYWEHLGMMDNPEYVETALQKIESYIKNGIYPGDGLILTFETKKTPISRKIVQRMMERYLKS